MYHVNKNNILSNMDRITYMFINTTVNINVLIEFYKLLSLSRCLSIPNQMWTYSSVELPSNRVNRTERFRIYLSECIVCFCILFFIVCVGLLLYLFFHLYSTVTKARKMETLIESWNIILSYKIKCLFFLHCNIV